MAMAKEGRRRPAAAAASKMPLLMLRRSSESLSTRPTPATIGCSSMKRENPCGAAHAEMHHLHQQAGLLPHMHASAPPTISPLAMRTTSASPAASATVSTSEEEEEDNVVELEPPPLPHLPPTPCRCTRVQAHGEQETSDPASPAWLTTSSGRLPDRRRPLARPPARRGLAAHGRHPPP